MPGIATEQLGARNQPWDTRVAEAVGEALGPPPAPARVAAGGPPALYAVHLRWYVQPASYPRDLDNLRLKPILDSLTRWGFWPGDDVQRVRALYSEAALVASADEQRVEVTVYGAPEP